MLYIWSVRPLPKRIALPMAIDAEETDLGPSKKTSDTFSDQVGADEKRDQRENEKESSAGAWRWKWGGPARDLQRAQDERQQRDRRQHKSKTNQRTLAPTRATDNFSAASSADICTGGNASLAVRAHQHVHGGKITELAA